MVYFNSLTFWCGVFFSYLFINLKVPFSKTFSFGIINFICLSVLFDIKLALACLGCVSLFWCFLDVIQDQKKSQFFFKLYSLLCIFFLVGLFLLHKSYLDNPTFFNIGHYLFDRYEPIQPVFMLMSTLAFSYIFLRFLDLFRAVMAGNTILDPFSLLGYLVPFYMLASGPVNVYTEYVATNQKKSIKPNFTQLLLCMNLITNGLFLKFVCAEGLRILFYGVNGKLQSGDLFNSAFILIYVFFDFAGYSYVAFGIGKLLDIPTPLNFQSPYISKTVTEFWTRWHVSLGDFVKRNIFIPLQVTMIRKWGITYAYWTNLIALIASFVFVGIWHRLSLKFIIWGIAVGCIVAVEKIIRDQIIKRDKDFFKKFSFGNILGPFYVFCVIVGTLHFAIQDLLGQ